MPLGWIRVSLLTPLFLKASLKLIHSTSLYETKAQIDPSTNSFIPYLNKSLKCGGCSQVCLFFFKPTGHRILWTKKRHFTSVTGLADLNLFIWMRFNSFKSHRSDSKFHINISQFQKKLFIALHLILQAASAVASTVSHFGDRLITAIKWNKLWNPWLVYDIHDKIKTNNTVIYVKSLLLRQNVQRLLK